jgi:hypothetical protein
MRIELPIAAVASFFLKDRTRYVKACRQKNAIGVVVIDAW